MPNLQLLEIPGAVVMTTPFSAVDVNVGIMVILGLQRWKVDINSLVHDDPAHTIFRGSFSNENISMA